jgi:ketosteroid isomerase-like protein
MRSIAPQRIPMHQHASETKAQAEVRRVVTEWAEAVRSRDRAGILRHHSSDIVMFDVPPPLQSKGIEAYDRTWDLFFSWSHDPVVFDILEMSITAGEEVAVVAAVMRCSGRETSGADIELQFRLTVGLRKSAGQWIVIHEHHSIPAVS